MAERQLSLASLIEQLDTQTARSFTEDEATAILSQANLHTFHLQHVPPLSIRAVLDGKELANETEDRSSWSFPIGRDDIRIHLHVEAENEDRMLCLSFRAPDTSEWSIMAQMRVHAGRDESWSKIVDRDLFRFERFHDTIRFRLDSDVNFLKFELRLVYLFFRAHPQFTEGDVVIRFADGSELKTWKALLALVSPYIAKLTQSLPQSGIIDVSPFDREPFVELLLQLMPTERPIGVKFKKLCHAAVSFDVQPVIARLSEYLVSLRKIALPQRMVDAVGFKLYSALSTMVEEAARRGLWTLMIYDGFDPVSSFGEEVYTKVVCPAVIRAEYPPSVLPPSSLPSDTSLHPSILGPVAASDPLNVPLSFLGTKFYVNSGVLDSHGGSSLAVDGEGLRHVRASEDLLEVCEEMRVPPGEVLFHLLLSLYPLSPHLPCRLSHPALILASDMGLSYAVERIEQLFLSTPVTTPRQFILHLELAQRYSLHNLLRAAALRAEGSCVELMRAVVVDPRFLALHSSTRQPILDRMCYGWAKGAPTLGIRMATEKLDRKLSLSQSRPSPLESDPATFRSIASDDVFGEPEPVAVE